MKSLSVLGLFYVFSVSLSFVVTFVCIKFSEQVIKNCVARILVICFMRLHSLYFRKQEDAKSLLISSDMFMS